MKKFKAMILILLLLGATSCKELIGIFDEIDNIQNDMNELVDEVQKEE